MADDLVIEAPPAPPARVWFGIIAPPAVWGLQGAVLWFVDWLACPMASAACMTSAGKHLWGVQLGVSLGALAVSLVAFALNVKPYQRVSGEPPRAGRSAFPPGLSPCRSAPHFSGLRARHRLRRLVSILSRNVCEGPMKRSVCAVALGLSVVSVGCRGGRADKGYDVPTGGDARRGEHVIRQTNCGSCHTIPGIREASGVVGPPLYFFARRTFIAGLLPNTPSNLVAWVMNPRAVEPRTAMPNLGLDEQQARDVAAYLYTLR